MKAALITSVALDASQMKLGERTLAMQSVEGRPWIDHQLVALRNAGISSLTCLIDPGERELAEHLADFEDDMQIEIVAQPCAHAIDALALLHGRLDERFLLLSSDALFPGDVLTDIIDSADYRPTADAIVGVSSFLGERDPLWVELHCHGHVMSIGPEARMSRLIATGITMLAPRTLAEVGFMQALGVRSYSRFLRHLAASSYRMFGERVPRGITLDAIEEPWTRTTGELALAR